jgi:DNA modification methylase
MPEDDRPKIRRPWAPRAEPAGRRALSNVGGAVEIVGDRGEGAVLGQALSVPPDPELARGHVHGFHSYPARLHPDIPRALVPALCPAGGAVLDPFCGSGTVLVEARLAGRMAIGVDANPIAIRLADLKATGRPAAHLEALVVAARAAATLATERRTRRVGASRRYPDEDTEAFAPHTLLELDGLRVGLEATRDPSLRADLELVLSSLLTKLSRRAGDSAEHQVEKRIAAGYPSKLFVGKATELAQRLTEYAALLPPGAPEPLADEGDARLLDHIGPASIDLVITSPPYPGNYDYLHHHAMRLRWLGLPSEGFAEREVGARRQLEQLSARDALATWVGDLESVLAELGRVLKPSGRAVLILADSVVGEVPYYNDDLVRDAAARTGLIVRAQASQRREHFHHPTRHAFGQRPRREHAISLAIPQRRR